MTYKTRSNSYLSANHTQQIMIHDRITSILSRILILQIMYELMAWICIIFAIFMIYWPSLEILFVLLWCMEVMIQSIAIYLMEEHNGREYRKFLRYIYDCRVYYICCCCYKWCDTMIAYDLNSEEDEREIPLLKSGGCQMNESGEEHRKSNTKTITNTNTATIMETRQHYETDFVIQKWPIYDSVESTKL